MPRTKPDLSWTRINIDAPELFPIHDAIPGSENITDAVVMDIHKIFPTPPGEKGWKVAPRRKADGDKHLELKRQISEAHARGLGINGTGIWQPIIVRRVEGDKFYITAGARRWRAAKEAGLSKIPVIVRDQATVDAYETALVENLLREDLTTADVAAALQSWMQDADLSMREIARRTGRSVSDISRAIGVSKDEVLMKAIEDGKITPSQAREMLNVPQPRKRALVDAVAEKRSHKEPVPLASLRAAAKAEEPDVALRNAASTPSAQGGPGAPILALVPEVLPAADLQTALFHVERAAREMGKLHNPPQYYHKELRKQVVALRARLDEIERVGVGAEAVEVAA